MTFSQFMQSLGIGEEASKQRLESLARMKAQKPTFVHGAGITIKPELNLETIEPVARPSHSIDTQGVIVEEWDSVEGASSIKNEPSDDFLSNLDAALNNHALTITLGAQAKSASVNLEIRSAPFISQTIIRVEPKAEATLLMTKRSSAPGYVSQRIKLVCGQESKLNLVMLEGHDKAAAFEHLEAEVGDNAKLNIAKLLGAGEYLSTSLKATLNKGSECEMAALFLANGRQRIDVYTLADHKQKHSVSNLITRGVVAGEAKALSRGLIRIGHEAASSQGYEKQDALLLGDSAEADAIPDLEIHNHDVKCSHGSSIGQLDFEKVFYIMSRGLSEADAKKKIIEGYFQQALVKLEPDIKCKIEEAVLARLDSIFEDSK